MCLDVNHKVEQTDWKEGAGSGAVASEWCLHRVRLAMTRAGLGLKDHRIEDESRPENVQQQCA